MPIVGSSSPDTTAQDAIKKALPWYYAWLIKKLEDHSSQRLVFQLYDIADTTTLTEKSPSEVIAALRRAGRALSRARVVNERIEMQANRSAVARDLDIGIQFLMVDARHQNGLMRFLIAILRNLRFMVPGAGTTAVLRAVMHPDINLRESPFGRPGKSADSVSIRVFGDALYHSAKTIVEQPHSVPNDVRNNLIGHVAGLEDLEGLSDERPRILEYQIEAIQLRLSDLTMPLRARNFFRHHGMGYAILVLALLGVATLSPWASLANKTAKVIDFTPALGLLLIANCCLCSLIASLIALSLQEHTIALMKTYARATTIFLAISTLLLSAGLAAGGSQGPLLAPGILIYIFILLSSLSADNLTFQADARMKVLMKSSATHAASRFTKKPQKGTLSSRQVRRYRNTVLNRSDSPRST